MKQLDRLKPGYRVLKAVKYVPLELDQAGAGGTTQASPSPRSRRAGPRMVGLRHPGYSIAAPPVDVDDPAGPHYYPTPVGGPIG
jgi:hypothetical protein